MTASKTFLTQPAPPAPVTVKEILDVQRKITEVDSAIADVGARILDAEKKIEVLRAGMPTPPDHREEREDLLAEIAVGNAKDEALVQFDKEAAVAVKAHDAAMSKIRKEISPVESVCAGLKRKSGVLSREIGNLRAKHRLLCQQYLLAAAEDAGREYAEAVTRAVKAMDLVIVFASLHKRCGGENRIGEDIGALDVPPLGTASTRGTLPALDPVARTAAYDAAEVKVLDLLKSDGLAVPFPETAPAKPAKVRVPGIGEGTPIQIMRSPDGPRAADGTPLMDTAIHEFDPHDPIGG